MEWPEVAVVGPGAVGAYFGGMLARGGASVTFFGRPGRTSPHLTAIREHGLSMKTTRFDERVEVATTDDLGDLEKAELVLFAVKSTDTDEAAKQIAPHLMPNVILLDLQNGVDNPEKIRRHGLDPFPTVVYVAASIEAPGEIIHRGRGDLVIGHETRKDDLSNIETWLEAAAIPCQVSDNVEKDQWDKLILNSMSNAISALTDKSYGALAHYEPTWQVALEVLDESIAVAEKNGFDIDRERLLDTALTLVTKIGDATSSTQQDIAKGRVTEVDSLNGFIAKQGEDLGIPTPVNKALWALVKLREQQ